MKTGALGSSCRAGRGQVALPETGWHLKRMSVTGVVKIELRSTVQYSKNDGG
jgi:hypothetical protein